MSKKLWPVMVLIVMVLYVLFLRTNHVLTTAQAKNVALQPNSHFIHWKGNPIHFTDEGKGPVILMIHGLGGSFYNFQAITERLKDSFRIIRVDFPGMGLSDFKQSGNDGLNYQQEARDFFHVFLDSIHVDSMFVMGNSMGGAMASLVSLEFPEKVKALVLLNSAGYEMDKVIKGPLSWNWFRPLTKRGMPMYMVEHFIKGVFEVPTKADSTEFPIDYAIMNREGVIKSMMDLATSGQWPDTAAFSRIKTPTLILWGKEDKITPVEHAYKFHRDIANSQMKIYSPCGHTPMMEIPDSVVADFKSFAKAI